MEIRPRTINKTIFANSIAEGLPPLLARILAGRLDSKNPVKKILKPKLYDIAKPSLLKNFDLGVNRIAKAILDGERIGIVTDYDADGLTSHAVIKTSFNLFDINPSLCSHWIGHRLTDGYGLTESLVDRIISSSEKPRLLVTADCGSSDPLAITRLFDSGIEVIVTDHHQVPSEGPPKDAFAVINPNQSGCAYPDKSIAGVMVAWLVMCGLRNQLIYKRFIPKTFPKLLALLDFVALGTIADCVSLGSSSTNRAVVLAGLKQMCINKRSAWLAACQGLNISLTEITAENLGFQIAPRLNARGRLKDPMAGLEFLLSDNLKESELIWKKLESNNIERRKIEALMCHKAFPFADRQYLNGILFPVIFLQDGHRGVQGIVASRIVDKTGCPALVFTLDEKKGELSGSIRSISEINIKDILDIVSKENPKLLKKYGGHALAAGLTIKKEYFLDLAKALDKKLKQAYPDFCGGPIIRTDGELFPEQLKIETWNSLQKIAPYGRGFEIPLFQGIFYVSDAIFLGKDKKHLRLITEIDGKVFKSIWFNVPKIMSVFHNFKGKDILMIYQISLDRVRKLQLLVHHGTIK